MKTLIKQIIFIFFKTCSHTTALFTSHLPKYPYRILSIEKNEDENYVAIIQVSNKNQIMKLIPEEILANDLLTDAFSPRDIRALAYLGYLGINKPKYKILAKRLCENDSKIVFALKEKGNRKPIIKTANEISADESIIKGLPQKDAHMVGYTFANEQIVMEENLKKNLLT